MRVPVVFVRMSVRVFFVICLGTIITATVVAFDLHSTRPKLSLLAGIQGRTGVKIRAGGSQILEKTGILALAELAHERLPGGRCPDWIEQYATFHRKAIKQNGSLSDASHVKFMIYSCDAVTEASCAGVGDRIRAMMETIKLAQYAARVVLFNWAVPAQLEDVLQPHLIDWRVKPDYKLGHVKNPVNYVWSTYKPYSNTSREPPQLVDGSFAKARSGLISISSNFLDQGGILPGPSLGRLNSFNRSCLFHALFKPSDALAQRVMSMRRILFGSSEVPYLAVHLRLGGFQGERRAIERFSHFSGLMVAISCARDLAASQGITAPILLLTDNAMLRDHVRSGVLAGFVTTPFPAMHVNKVASDMGADLGKQALVTSFLDLALLADAKCLIGSPSGFSTVAGLWGQHKCSLMIEQCIAAYAPAELKATQ